MKQKFMSDDQDLSNLQGHRIFCDGACKHNPGPGGWGGILLMEQGEVFEWGGGDHQTTNNRMEMIAAITCLQNLDLELRKKSSIKPLGLKSETVHIFTDSQYLIKGISEWIHGWKKRGWLTSQGEPVLNRDLWMELDSITQKYEVKIMWHHVRGHHGIPGNERADKIAVSFSQNNPIVLYNGPYSNYPHDLFQIKSDLSQKTHKIKTGQKQKNTSIGKTYSKPLTIYNPNFNPSMPFPFYMSFVDGQIRKHGTWVQCEQTVKGRRGARFKKISSPDEEQATLEGWGVS